MRTYRQCSRQQQWWSRVCVSGKPPMPRDCVIRHDVQTKALFVEQYAKKHSSEGIGALTAAEINVCYARRTSAGR